MVKKKKINKNSKRNVKKINQRTTREKAYRFLMWIGFLMITPILFLGDQTRGTIWHNVLGTLSLIGVLIEAFYFFKLLQIRKSRKK